MRAGHAGCANISTPPVLQVHIGETAEQPFTACDLEALPVSHSLPSARDARTFVAKLARLGGKGWPDAATATAQAVVYASAGVYEVSVVAPSDIGYHQLSLALDDEPIDSTVSVQVTSTPGPNSTQPSSQAQLRSTPSHAAPHVARAPRVGRDHCVCAATCVQVLCPRALIELGDGASCGCEEGSYLKASGEELTGSETCERCLPYTYAARGQRECQPCGKPSADGEDNEGMECEGGVLNGTRPNFWVTPQV